jgi:NAD-dependent deacetylase
MLAEAEPNAAHRALASLERGGLVEAVVTQNIDLLHERAGSRNLVEVHGSIRTATCPFCGLSYQRDVVITKLERADAPACDGCGGILKPDVVFFGELLPVAAIERAFELARRAGLLLVVGSSLEVHPVAALPEETLAASGRLAIVNKGPTPYDPRAEVKLDENAGEALGAVADELLP